MIFVQFHGKNMFMYTYDVAQSWESFSEQITAAADLFYFLFKKAIFQHHEKTPSQWPNTFFCVFLHWCKILCHSHSHFAMLTSNLKSKKLNLFLNLSDFIVPPIPMSCRIFYSNCMCWAVIVDFFFTFTWLSQTIFYNTRFIIYFDNMTRKWNEINSAQMFNHYIEKN